MGDKEKTLTIWNFGHHRKKWVKAKQAWSTKRYFKRMETDVWPLLSKKESRKKMGQMHFPKSSFVQEVQKDFWGVQMDEKLQEGSQVNYIHTFSRPWSCS